VVGEVGGGEAGDPFLLATGYRPNLDYLRPLGVLREDGRPDQRAGIARSVPGLYFVGLPFQTSFASATLRGVGSDAELVVARARRQVAHSVMEPTEHPASVMPPRRVCDASATSVPASGESGAAECSFLERASTYRRKQPVHFLPRFNSAHARNL
jgi:hypothetical protein